MDLRKLQIFNRVAHYSSFTKAAEALHMAQPAVSIAVKKLESELDLILFHRQDKQIQLTTEGQALLRHSDAILESVRLAKVEMDELKGLLKGEVRVGIPSMLGSYYFPETLMAFKAKHPELCLSVTEGGARSIQQQIAGGSLDIGILVNDQIPESLATEPLLREEMVVAVPPEHPFAVLDSVKLEDFFQEDLVLFKEGFFHREYIEQLSINNNQPFKLAAETNLIALSCAIVKEGFGVTTLLRGVVENTEGLVAVSFHDQVWLDLCVAWKRGAYLSFAERRFVEFLLETMKA